MPVWYEQTKGLRDKGALGIVGIIQEQHPARCRLFMQWKQLDFPVMVDSLNRLGVKVVPMTVAIDEHGIVRHVGMAPGDLEKEFLSKTYAAPTDSVPRVRKDTATLRQRAVDRNTSVAWMTYADALVLERGVQQLDAAISAYQRAITLDRTNGDACFRMGVAYRMRYDQRSDVLDDFRSAVAHWGMALDLDPNQYIWRRRIQQYGPRLDKPYPFYNWVRRARREVIGRGEKPIVLPVEPRGAELALPAKQLAAATQDVVEPDPSGEIERDRTLVLIDTATVPAAVNPQDTVRVHMTFRVNSHEETQWNNESGPMEIWISPPHGWDADPRIIRPELPDVEETNEIRNAEMELQVPKSAKPGVTTVPAYALYFVCRGKDGACLYRRQDFVVRVTVRKRLPRN